MKHMTTKQKILSKTKRVIAIYLLLRKKDKTIVELAKRFKVNERSIQRDIKLLKEAGVVIEKSHLGYWVDKRMDYVR